MKQKTESCEVTVKPSSFIMPTSVALVVIPTPRFGKKHAAGILFRYKESLKHIKLSSLAMSIRLTMHKKNSYA